MMRRSRGYVPQSVRLPLEVPAALGCGAELKSTFCVAKGGRAWPSHHIGDLKNWETLDSFREGVEHFERLFAVEPRVIAHDLHPDYLSTRYAQERADGDPELELVGVQHHHAHLAACLAEHGETGPALGVIFDGTGYGEDASVWGGELLAGDLAGFERAGMLMPVRLPGGDRAVQEPWRMAASWLSHALDDELPAIPPTLREHVRRRGLGGGVRHRPDGRRIAGDYECRSPLRRRLGALRHPGEGDVRGPGRSRARRRRRPGRARRVRDPDRGRRPGAARARSAPRDPRAPGRPRCGSRGPRSSRRAFTAGSPRSAAAAAERACRERGLDTVVLSGGVFQNRLLLERARDELDEAGLRTLVPVALPAQRRRHLPSARSRSPRRARSRAKLTQVSPTYQSPNRTPNAPRSGIRTVR